ncbi:hypothetical protein GCM10027059_22490 [Myceligenerans halotolerans]
MLITATDPERLDVAARCAVDEGLAVWLQPRPFDRPAEELLEAVRTAATTAEDLHTAGADVGLVVGCELTLSTPGMLPGPTFWTRGMLLSVTFPLLPLANRRLRMLLGQLVSDARDLLAEAIPEEVVFRGYVTTVLGSVTRGWWVITIQAVLFTLFAGALRQHWNPMDLSLFLAMGIGFGYLRMITGSVWMPVGFHTAFQTGSQLVLTHDAVEFTGGQIAGMLALGAVPFAVAAVVVSSTGIPRFVTRPATAPRP